MCVYALHVCVCVCVCMSTCACVSVCVCVCVFGGGENKARLLGQGRGGGLFTTDDSAYQGFQIRMVYLYYILCLRYTILVGNPRYVCA